MDINFINELLMEERLDITFFTLISLMESMAAIQWCIGKGLLAEHYTCSKCGEPAQLKNRGGNVYKWVCQKGGVNPHYFVRSIRKNTWFGRSNMTISKILLITVHWIYGTTLSIVSHDLDLSRNTLTDWYSFCREVCLDVMVRDNTPIGGPGKILEIDESFRKKKRQPWALGARKMGAWRSREGVGTSVPSRHPAEEQGHHRAHNSSLCSSRHDSDNRLLACLQPFGAKGLYTYDRQSLSKFRGPRHWRPYKHNRKHMVPDKEKTAVSTSA
ncbi:hypothetical protein LAZ67_15000156 [Cordylochernes scorpioides]|uniref:Transposase n=1 Tax=Cordylochernes scorpioides TaxID=51811 RepID=A0ABY6L7V4_9ARAC|nr:hypothetical protein LAZ67_15000156 [Cordylochernes scorpioides]